MALARVTAHFLDDDTKNAAMEIMGKGAHLTQGFVYGEMDEADIPKLEKAGLIVQCHVTADHSSKRKAVRALRLRAARPAPAPGPMAPPAAMSPPAPLPEMSTLTGSAESPSDVFPADLDFYVLMLRGPLIEPWKQQLTALRVQLMEAQAAGGYKVRMRLEDIGAVKALDFVESLDWISPAASAPQITPLSAELAAAAATPLPLTFDVRLQFPADLQKVLQWLRDHHVNVIGSGGRKIRFEAVPDAPELTDLGNLPEVDQIAEYVEPKLNNDIARVLLKVDAPPGANPPTLIAQDGTGQIVAVADTGIDDQHPDLQNRIVGRVALGRPGDTTDPHGHGTHVAGSVAGDGAASGGKIRGVAPKAGLFFQSLLDAKGGLGGLPVDLNELFEEAYQAGSRIHNNSWGAGAFSRYTMSSEEVDEFVAKRRDMLVVIAAGNSGTGAQPANSAAGFVDWLSIESPASSKNGLTVGASRSSRTDGAAGASKWGQKFRSMFPDPPIADDLISGDPECMAAFSSRGPCDDLRIKPDVVAPGTDIASTRSHLAADSTFWGPYPVNDKYAYSGGTSMAAPLVAGCAALVRQYFIDQCHHQPSAALLKATLINSAQWLSGADATAPKVGAPNYHQGHGRVSMTRAIPNASDPALQLQFVDDWQDQTKSFTRTGDQRRYQLLLPAGVPELRLCMVYTDAPARALQNDLNLIVLHVPSKQKWTGNATLPDHLTALDTTNNVEKIAILNPPAGNYIIQVVITNLLKAPQDFALVVAGANVPALTSI